MQKVDNYINNNISVNHLFTEIFCDPKRGDVELVA